jgi:hypothetical protein
MTRYTPLWEQSGSYAASVDRHLISSLWPNPASTGCALTAQAGTMTVNVAAGTVAVPSQNATGSTLCVSDAVEQVVIAAAPGSGQNRIDLVICRPRGTDLDGGANNDFIFDTVAGVPAASPVAPAVPAGTVLLGQVLVPGGSAAVTQANITDGRPGGFSPLRTVGRAVGPAAQVNLPAAFGFTTVLTVTVPVVAGRRYRVYANAFINIGGSAVSNRNAIQVAPVDVTHVSANTGRVQILAQTNGSGFAPNGTWTYTAPSTGNQTFTLAAGTDQASTVAVNNAELSIDDIGPP